MSDNFVNSRGVFGVPIRNPSQPVFSSTISVSQIGVTGDGTNYTPVYDNVIIDNKNALNTSTGIYTIPEDGNYIFGGGVFLQGLNVVNTSLLITAQIGSFGHTALQINVGAVMVAPGQFLYNWSDVATPLVTGDEVSVLVRVDGGAKVVDMPTFFLANRFEGVMVC